MKEVTTEKLESFEIGIEINAPVWNFVSFQQRERESSQNLNNYTFYRVPVTSAHCLISTEIFHDSAVLINYDDVDFSQRYGQIKEAIKVLTKDDILKPYITEHDFRTSNEGNNSNDIGYNLYVFEIRYEKNFESAQPLKVDIKFLENRTAGIYGYALVLTNKIVSINSDGQRHFDLI